MQTIIRLILYIGCIVSVRVVSIVLCFTTRRGVREVPSKYLSVISNRYMVYVLIIVCEIVVCVIIFVVSVRFYRYHVWLRISNLTTYQHIMNKRNSISVNKIKPLEVQPSAINQRMGTKSIHEIFNQPVDGNVQLDSNHMDDNEKVHIEKSELPPINVTLKISKKVKEKKVLDNNGSNTFTKSHVVKYYNVERQKSTMMNR